MFTCFSSPSISNFASFHLILLFKYLTSDSSLFTIRVLFKSYFCFKDLYNHSKSATSPEHKKSSTWTTTIMSFSRW